MQCKYLLISYKPSETTSRAGFIEKSFPSLFDINLCQNEGEVIDQIVRLENQRNKMRFNNEPDEDNAFTHWVVTPENTFGPKDDPDSYESPLMNVKGHVPAEIWKRVQEYLQQNHNKKP